MLVMLTMKLLLLNILKTFTSSIRWLRMRTVHMIMDSQPEINEKMAILIDWLDVHTKFDLSPEILYLTINIVDRFLDVNLVPRRELQLVGISAMLMTSKYEEIWPPEVNDFVTLSDYAYTHEQILIMDKTILGV